MTLRQQLGSLLTVGVSGHELTQDERSFLVENNIGGVILFKRNFSSPEQVLKLSTEIHRLGLQSKSGLPILVSVDQEGGRVQRFRSPFTEWPAMKAVGDLGSAMLAFQVAHGIGLELSCVGVHIDFAPSVDVLTNPLNTVIGDRALATDSDRVGQLGSALVRGFLKAGITPVAKHFPGHGHTLIDSHEDLPREKKSASELLQCEVEPFRKAVRARLPAIMTSHILFESIDADRPASLSPILTEKWIRGELKFRGLIYTDDLDMGALRKHWSQADIAVLALNAGADQLLYCNDPESPRIALDALEAGVKSEVISSSRLSTALHQARAFRESTVKRFMDAGNLRANGLALVGAAPHQALAASIRAGKVPAEMS